jgi:NADH:ubiquinone oxidoreductase subunit 2 (subunit N)
MYNIFGTSDWDYIQYYYLYTDKKNINNMNLNLLLTLFIFSVFIKLGVAPLHLFKIEVYNGLPYITIFFYTTFYFLIFFLFFLFFLLNFLNVFLQQIYLLFFFVIFFGVTYTVVLLFDVGYIKTFFAYSTIINSIGFITVFISSL